MIQQWSDRCHRHAVASTAVLAAVATAVTFISPVAQRASAGTTTTTAPTTTTTAVPGSNCSALESGFTLDRAGWEATSNAPSSSADAPSNALDGNYSSRFSTDKDQVAGLYFDVSLGKPSNFNELKMSMPGSPNDYARGFDAYVSNDGSTWSKVASCTGSSTPQVVSFSPQTAQYVKVVLTASADVWWSVDEFNLSNPTTQPTTTTTDQPTTTTTTPATTTTTSPLVTTTTTVPPFRYRGERCLRSWPHFLVRGSLIATRQGFFAVMFPCAVRLVLGARVLVAYHVEHNGRVHTRYRWSDRFRLGAPKGRRLVELRLGGGDWLRWDGRVYVIRSLSLLS
jgi:hypothetical protein